MKALREKICLVSGVRFYLLPLSNICNINASMPRSQEIGYELLESEFSIDPSLMT